MLSRLVSLRKPCHPFRTPRRVVHKSSRSGLKNAPTPSNAEGESNFSLFANLNLLEGSDSFIVTAWRDLKLFYKLAKPHRVRLLVGLSCLGVSTSAFLAVPKLLGQAIDSTTQKSSSGAPNLDFLAGLATWAHEHTWGIVALLFVGALSFTMRVYCLYTAGQLITNDLRRSVFSAVLAQDTSFFDRNRVGEIVSRLSGASLSVGRSVSRHMADGIRAGILGVGSAALMATTAWPLFQTTLYAAPVAVGIFFIYGRTQFTYTADIVEAVTAANSCAIERLSKVATVRALRSEDCEKRAFAEKLSVIWALAKKEAISRGLLQGAFQLTGYSTFVLVLFQGYELTSQGLLSFGDLSSFCLYYALFSRNVMAITDFYTELMKALGSSSKLFSLNLQPPRILLKGGVVIEKMKEGIEFDNVVFSYFPDQPKILNGLSFSIPAGKTTAIVGHSSHSGRTTIARLILRLYDPIAGEIRVDGHPLPEIDLSSWRRNIAVVKQEPVFLPGTIRENITYGLSREISEEELDAALTVANCHTFINGLPHGMDTMLTDADIHILSAGQKKRLAIARAIVRKSPLLILDEATSGVDALSEVKIRDSIRKLLAMAEKDPDQTVFAVANRIIAVRRADQIVVVDHGRVSQVGKFDELLREKNGIFRELVDRQTIRWEDE